MASPANTQGGSGSKPNSADSAGERKGRKRHCKQCIDNSNRAGVLMSVPPSGQSHVPTVGTAGVQQSAEPSRAPQDARNQGNKPSQKAPEPAPHGTKEVKAFVRKVVEWLDKWLDKRFVTPAVFEKEVPQLRKICSKIETVCAEVDQGFLTLKTHATAQGKARASLLSPRMDGGSILAAILREVEQEVGPVEQKVKPDAAMDTLNDKACEMNILMRTAYTIFFGVCVPQEMTMRKLNEYREAPINGGAVRDRKAGGGGTESHDSNDNDDDDGDGNAAKGFYGTTHFRADIEHAVSSWALREDMPRGGWKSMCEPLRASKELCREVEKEFTSLRECPERGDHESYVQNLNASVAKLHQQMYQVYLCLSAAEQLWPTK
eukprot:g64852.t1